ncbi:SixA phosphatase family protein [Acidimangrovimonas sediminis]|uniref:SixA phosphatase family protein n=1 Tax=Acidimangrovimonas sediminis TaxID=2056283 RepID=UPI000C8012AD|nr:histidine phosphatase family protein [Acidimangrovimonas sediminis]
MPKRLILIRHAKSSWDDPLMPDHARPLNTRGQRAAAEIGAWLTSRGYLPDTVLCSNATRTTETWARLSEHLEGAPEAKLLPTLYNAAADVIMAVLRHAVGDTVMVIGHNPGIAEFAHRLVARAPLHPEFQKFPTGATLVAEFEIDSWEDASFAKAGVVDFVVPRDLEE